jgi:putative DNA primase/helicase
VSWTDILTPHGWTLLHTAADVGFWRRPGKTEPSPSATTNYKGCDLLYVFSSNAYPFEPETTYSKFAAFATLNCGGDYRLAAQRLARLGFGERVIDRRAK